MDDVTARIAIAVQNGDSLRQIGKVKKGIREISDQRMRDLRLAQSSAKLELAEYNSMIAAQKAYNAEIRMSGTEKRIRFRKSEGAGAGEIEKMTRLYDKQRETYLKAQAAEASANIAAYQAKVSHDNLKRSLSENVSVAKTATRGMREYSASTIAARSASRLLGIDIGEGVNPAMIKMGVIVAGAASAMKLAGLAMEYYTDKARYAAELSHRNLDSVSEANTRFKEQADKQREVIDSITNLQNKERLSNVEKLEMSKLLKELKIDYHALGGEIDATTGKIANWDKVSAVARKQMLAEEISNLEREIKQISADRQEIMKTLSGENGVAAWLYDTARRNFNYTPYGRIGNALMEATGLHEILREPVKQLTTSEERRLVTEELTRYNEIGEKQSSLYERLENARKQLAEFDTEESKAAKSKADDLAKAINKEREQLKIQELRLKGREREAKIIEIFSKWEEKRGKYGNIVDELKMRDLNLYDMEIVKQRFAEYAEIARDRFKYRQTAQSSVLANSLEGARLQSRMMIQNSGVNLSNNPQKITAEQSKKQTTLLEEVRNLLDDFVNNTTPISTRPVR